MSNMNISCTTDKPFLNDYMKNNRLPNGLVKWIVLKDGFEFSCQAREFNYCEPRVDNAEYYYRVELGFPTSRFCDEIHNYAEDPDDPTETVYGYVPIELVERFIMEHGGIVEQLLLEGETR